MVLNKVTVNNLTISATTNPLMGTTPPRVSKGTILKHPLFDFDNSSIYYRNEATCIYILGKLGSVNTGNRVRAEERYYKDKTGSIGITNRKQR